MNRHHGSRTFTAVVALVATATLAGGASSLLATPSKQVTQRINLVERVAGEQFVDTGKHGLSVGDHNVIRSDILDRSGKVVGRGDIDCTITGVGPHMGGLCHGVLTLPAGQLVAEFAFGPSGSTKKQAIVGGSGAYEGARGQAVVDVNGTDEREPFTIELLG